MIDAGLICRLFVETARNVPGSNAGGIIPRDTGLLQLSSINELFAGYNCACVNIGGERGALAYYAPYLEYNYKVGKTNKINKHRGWVEKFIQNDFVNVLKQFGDVKIYV